VSFDVSVQLDSNFIVHGEILDTAANRSQGLFASGNASGSRDSSVSPAR
jgi:hypothetical protein